MGEADQRLAAIEARLARGGERMDDIERQLTENTRVTVEVRDILGAIKGGLKFLGWMGVVVKWIGAFTATAASIWGLVYMATHGGKPPTP